MHTFGKVPRGRPGLACGCTEIVGRRATGHSNRLPTERASWSCAAVVPGASWSFHTAWAPTGPDARGIPPPADAIACADVAGGVGEGAAVGHETRFGLCGLLVPVQCRLSLQGGPCTMHDPFVLTAFAVVYWMKR
jgi:hypothetical protein